MNELIGAVFLASLLGSLHCAGMCGAFVALAVAGDGPADTPRRSQWATQTAYHLGRLVTYCTLGAFAGALGAALNLGGSAIGIAHAAAITAGICMIGFGISMVLRHRGVALPRIKPPKPMQQLLRKGHGFAFSRPPVQRAGVIGLLTTLLPCGWLYAFTITAAGTGHPLHAVITMSVFWLGTLPVMISVGVGVQALTGPLRTRVPMLTSWALIIVGVVTVAQRAGIRMPDAATAEAQTVAEIRAAQPACCPPSP